MNRLSYVVYILVALLTFVSLVSAASPTSFCKCTCFANSTIIPLNSDPSAESVRTALEARASKRTCNDCNRQFCLSYDLPFCKDAKEENVFTTCFQRDSVKDQAVVFIFIFATVGLLIYAGIRPFIERWAQNARERRSYMPVPNQGDSN